ncbi:MAG: MFS transporter [Anaerolineaceae bacterium]|nr:MFS transporter [Anaerolineaceae bacterium]
MNSTTNERLSRRTKMFYGAGDFGFSMNNSIIGILFAIFLTDVVGLAPSLAAAAIFIGRSWDYINDPIIGNLSDRTRTRWGRRRPFLLFGLLPFALAFAALWWRPPITQPVLLAGYYALAYLLYDAAATFVYMPYYALTPDLTQDYDDRTTLTSYRMVFNILGGLVAFTLPLALIGVMRPENAGRVSWMGFLFGLLAALPLLLTFFGTRERNEYQEQKQPGLLESLRAAFKNRPFLYAAGVFLFTWTALEIVQGMLLYFLKYRLHMENDSDLISGAVFIAALAALPMWERLTRRWDKRKAYIAGMIYLSLMMVLLIAVQPGWGVNLVVVLAALIGIGVGAMHVIPWAMIPDSIELDELETGQRHEGMFYSLVLTLRKISQSIALPSMLLILDWNGFVSNASVQTPAALNAIGILTGLVPVGLLVVGIIFALLYPLSRERHSQLRDRLAKRHMLPTSTD